MLGFNNAKLMLLRACFGALFGAVVAATSLFALPRTSLSFNQLLELPLWMAVMAATVFPVAVLSAACARIALHRLSWPPLITASAAATALGVVSVCAFGWYMTEVAPGTNWSKGWWVPAAASVSTVLVEAAARLRTLKTANV
jgi:hypothetical protein